MHWTRILPRPRWRKWALPDGFRRGAGRLDRAGLPIAPGINGTPTVRVSIPERTHDRDRGTC